MPFLTLFFALFSHCFKAFKPRIRIFTYAINHHHQIAPFHWKRSTHWVVHRQTKGAFFEPFHVQYQSAIFGMQQLDGSTAATDKNKNIAHSDIITHLVLNNTTQRVHPFSHIGFAGTQKIAHRVI